MLKRLFSFLSKPAVVSSINGLFIYTLLILNARFQAFCIPAPWAIILLVICFANMIVYPFITSNRWLVPLSGFVSGVSFFVFAYCIIFLEHFNWLGLVALLVGIGLIFYIPHFFVVQLVWKNLVRPVSRVQRYFFLLALLVCSGITVYTGQQYKQAIAAIEAFEQSGRSRLEKNFLTEKILGMHFIYHTRLCEFDGWRPPKHEPILVIGMWLNGRHDPLDVSLEERLALYKKFFPGNRYKFDCACSEESAGPYHSDDLWR